MGTIIMFQSEFLAQQKTRFARSQRKKHVRLLFTKIIGLFSR